MNEQFTVILNPTRPEMESCIETLSTSRNVDEWNLLRRDAKQVLSLNEISLIDASGLIGKVRESNNWPKKD